MAGNTESKSRGHAATKLIVNADDFGRSPGVSRGILKAHREGIVTSTTVMVNQPGVADSLREALNYPTLGLGLHLVFTAWQPVLPPSRIPTLVDSQGSFLDQHTVWAAGEHVSLQQLRDEFSAQVDRFAELTGHLPDHLDCHHFVHLYPPFFSIYADLAAQLKVPLRAPFPVETAFDRAMGTLPFLEGFPTDLVRGMIVTNSALLRARRLAHPTHFESRFFGAEAVSLGQLLRLLDNLPAGVSELMCHPGFADAGLGQSTYQQERELELVTLTHPALPHELEQRGIQLTTFSCLT
jgi:predicted glycoside hydrolase/deacetylase ChbG (UPF0249 family)